MILTRSKQILAEPEDRALLNCLTLSFSYIMIAFLLFYTFCGCPGGRINPTLIQDGTEVEPLTEPMKWSDIVFNWFTGSSADEVKHEDTIIEDVDVAEKEKVENSNSIRALLKSYLAPLVEVERRSPGLSSYFALAEEITDDNNNRRSTETGTQGEIILDF